MDGRKLASLHHQGITLWDVGTGKELVFFPIENPTVIALNRDGSVLAYGTDKTGITLLDVSTGETLQEIPLPEKDWPNYLLFSSDSRWLISAHGNHEIGVWDVQTGERRRTLQEHSEQVISLSLLDDGNTLYSFADDGMLCIWNLSSGQLVAKWDASPGPVSKDGRLLVTADEESGALHVWSITLKRKLRTLTYQSPWSN